MTIIFTRNGEAIQLKNGAALQDIDQSDPALSQGGGSSEMKKDRITDEGNPKNGHTNQAWMYPEISGMSRFWLPEILYKMLFEPEFLMIAKGRFSSE